EQIISIIKERTGRDATIKGAVTVSLLPLPTLFIPGLEIREPESETPSSSPAPAMAVDLIRIRVPLFSVFSETPSVSAVILENPVLELVRPEKGTINWDWLNSSLLESLTQNRDTGALQVEIHSGKVL